MEDRAIHTDRLVMRPLIDDDAAALFRIYSHRKQRAFGMCLMLRSMIRVP